MTLQLVDMAIRYRQPGYTWLLDCQYHLQLLAVSFHPPLKESLRQSMSLYYQYALYSEWILLLDLTDKLYMPGWDCVVLVVEKDNGVASDSHVSSIQTIARCFFVSSVAVDRKICAQVATITIKCNDAVARRVVWYTFDILVADLVLDSCISIPVGIRWSTIFSEVQSQSQSSDVIWGVLLKHLWYYFSWTSCQRKMVVVEQTHMWSILPCH